MTYDERDIEMLEARLHELRHEHDLAELSASDYRIELSNALADWRNVAFRQGALLQKWRKALIANANTPRFNKLYDAHLADIGREVSESARVLRAAIEAFASATRNAEKLYWNAAYASRDLAEAKERAGIIPAHSFDFDDERES